MYKVLLLLLLASACKPPDAKEMLIPIGSYGTQDAQSSQQVNGQNLTYEERYRAAYKDSHLFNPLAEASTYSYYTAPKAPEEEYYRHINTFVEVSGRSYIRAGAAVPTSMNISNINSLGINPNYDPNTQSTMSVVNPASLIDVQTVDNYRNMFNKQHGGLGANFSSQNFGLTLAYGYQTPYKIRYEYGLEFYQGISNINPSQFTDSSSGTPMFDVRQYAYQNNVLTSTSATQYGIVQTIARHIAITGSIFRDFDEILASTKTFKKFVPYIGVGIGISDDFGYMRAGSSIYTASSLLSNPAGEARTPVNYNNFGLMGQGMIGVRHKTSDIINIDLRIGYEYGKHFNAPSVESYNSAYLNPGALSYNITYIQLGVMFYIGNTTSDNHNR